MTRTFFIKARFDNKFILSNINKLIHYYSQLKKKKSKVRIEFEEILDGIIIIYEDFNYFLKIAENTTIDEIPNKETLFENEFVQFFTKFPEKGLHLQLSINNNENNNALTIIESYCKRINKNLNINCNSEVNCSIFFPDIKSFQDIIADFIYRFLEK